MEIETFNNNSSVGVIAFEPWRTYGPEFERDHSRWYCHLTVAGERIFEYGSPCGTCGIVFRKIGSTDHQVTDSEAVQLLGALDALPSDAAIRRLARVLPTGQYHPVIIEEAVVRVEPGSSSDYFATDVVRLFGLDPPDEPSGPKIPYYRLGLDHELARGGPYGPYKALVTAVVMPLHDPNRLNRERIEYWKRQLDSGVTLTAFAVSIVDDQAPAVGGPDDSTYQYEEQFLFANCLIDGHHRLQAASETSARVRLLSLLTKEFSLVENTDDINAVVKPYLR